MFHLNKANASINNINLRSEKAEDGDQPASDIKISIDLSAERLNDIAPGLCESLFRKPAKGDQLPLVEVGKKPEPGFTVLKIPGLEPLQLKQRFPGYELIIASDNDSEGLFFADGEVKNFTIKAHDGGTANVKFSVGVHIEKSDLAGLWDFLHNPSAVITLTPPKAEADKKAA